MLDANAQGCHLTAINFEDRFLDRPYPPMSKRTKNNPKPIVSADMVG